MMCAFLLADEFMFTCPGKLATHVFWRTIKNGMKGIGNIIHMLNEAIFLPLLPQGSSLLKPPNPFL